MTAISNSQAATNIARRILIRWFTLAGLANIVVGAVQTDEQAWGFDRPAASRSLLGVSSTSSSRAQKAAAVALRAAQDFFAEADKVVQQRRQELQVQNHQDAKDRIRRAISKARAEAEESGMRIQEPEQLSLIATEVSEQTKSREALWAPACQTGGKECSGHGACNATGGCNCTEGWIGETCAYQPCPMNCSSRGICIADECECDLGYAGQFCEQYRCPNDCYGQGVCFSGVCQCMEGYSGEDCGTKLTLGQVIRFKLPEALPRLRGFGDQGASTLRTSGERTCVQDCGSNGFCGEDGTCTCSAGFSGASCETYCPGGCTGHGMCINGACLCNAGYEEADCSATSACSGHGQTSAFGCHCDSGWSGADCRIELVCADAQCGGNGVCVHGACLCSVGFTGESCTEFITSPDCTGPDCVETQQQPMALAEAAAPVVFVGHNQLQTANGHRVRDGLSLGGDAALEYRRQHVTSDAKAAPVMSLAQGTMSAAVSAAKDFVEGGREAVQTASEIFHSGSTPPSATSQGTARAAPPKQSPLTASWIQPGEARSAAGGTKTIKALLWKAAGK
mmetsp:Transcript_43652/g.79621  ORF Transcript_43652/g.79621 Transcript_43652/m.79621 type:complete len:565 (-) Transcript_43652:66-1760(-)